MAEPLSERALERLLAGAREIADSGGGAAQVLGKYRLLRELGRGGMGVVWEAQDTELGRRAAVKILNPTTLTDPEARQRFLREARAAARIVHPNVAAVYDADESAIAMQLVDGQPLSALRGSEPRRLARLVRDAARGVQAAHEQGVVHRDLKPHNLLVEGERVFVTDFGLAKDHSAEGALSRTGVLLGTPAYMAPEQAAGRGHEVDARSDVWSLGATLYDLLAGQPPFAGADVVDLLRRIAESEPRRLRGLAPSVPGDLERVVHKCLAKEPAQRYPSAAALADDLTRWLDGRPVEARSPSLGYRLVLHARRHKALVTVAGVALLVLVAAALALALERGRRRTANRAVELTQHVANTLADVEMHRRLGELERAGARLEAALADVRDFLGAHEIAAARTLEGRLLAARGREEQALAAFDRALALAPDSGEAHLRRGLLLAARAGTESVRASLTSAGPEDTSTTALAARARADLEAAGSALAQERSPDVLLAQAELLRLAGDRAGARTAFAEVLRLDPLNASAKLALSELALLEGDADQAWYLAMGVLDLDRGFGPAYEARSRPEEAGELEYPQLALPGLAAPVADFAAAVRASPSDAAAHANRGVAQLRELARSAPERALELSLAAIESFDAAVKIEPALTPAWYDLGLARFERARRLGELGRLTEARVERDLALQALDRALELDPAASSRALKAQVARLLE